MTSNQVNFTGDCGENPESYNCARSPGMQPNQSATVNGNPPQNCVIGNSGAMVYQIDLIATAGYYNYQVRVEAQGPSGMGSGYLHLAFEDASGDVYYLKIYSSTREWHTVSYNSDAPNIVAIYWSDVGFDLPSSDSQRAKPDFSVTSPDKAK